MQKMKATKSKANMCNALDFDDFHHPPSSSKLLLDWRTRTKSVQLLTKVQLIITNHRNRKHMNFISCLSNLQAAWTRDWRDEDRSKTYKLDQKVWILALQYAANTFLGQLHERVL